MRPYKPDISPEAAKVIRHLPPSIKANVREAIRHLCGDPALGEPLRAPLDGYWKFRARRYRIVYEIIKSSRTIRIVAVGHRRTIYDLVVRDRK